MPDKYTGFKNWFFFILISYCVSANAQVGSESELKKEGEDLILVLIPELSSNTTMIVYASRDTDITKEQRDGIVEVVQQLRGAATKAPQ